MDLKYKFTAKEYATMQGITASALRKRRLAGKLDGQYIKKGSDYFYCITRTDGPTKQSFTLKNSRRRHVPRSEVQYHKAHNGGQLQQANDIKQLCAINKRLSEAGIQEIVPDIIEVAKQRRIERSKKVTESLTKVQKNYGGFISCNTGGYKDIKPEWKTLFEKDQPQEKEVKQKVYYY
jgi:glutamate dehydrogenase/leucine dehydrogenase